MHLLIDIGNTALKWSIESDRKFQGMVRFSYQTENLSNQLTANITSFKLTNISHILISNVAGNNINQLISQWCEDKFKITPYFAKVTRCSNGLVNAYSPPEKLGIDRWLALIAANARYNTPICIIDCGTAVTIDGIDQHNQFIGGAILPGLALMNKSLRQGTDGIGQIPNVQIKNVFGKNTQQGVLSGTTLAITSLIENMSAKLRIQTEKDVTCILTGGDAEVIERHLSLTVELVPDLVLQGLYLWGKENVLD